MYNITFNDLPYFLLLLCCVDTTDILILCFAVFSFYSIRSSVIYTRPNSGISKLICPLSLLVPQHQRLAWYCFCFTLLYYVCSIELCFIRRQEKYTLFLDFIYHFYFSESSFSSAYANFLFILSF